MFGSFSAAFGGARTPANGEETKEQASSEQQPAAGAARALWGVASALSASVKQRTAELAASIQETDWRSELTALQQGLKEDTGGMQQRAKAATQELGHRAKAAAEQLPSAMEHLPERGAALQARAAEAGHHLQQAGRSLGSLGQRLVHTSTELFDQINAAVQSEMAAQDGGSARGGGARPAPPLGAVRYSRFEADVAAMQRDSGTYCDEPDDGGDFAAWHAAFDLGARKGNVDALVSGNTFMSELQSRIVPAVVEYDLFWTRYFYRLHKLQQRHAAFAALTQRAEAGAVGGEEEVGWGSEGDDAEGAAQTQGQAHAAAADVAEESGTAKTEVAAAGAAVVADVAEAAVAVPEDHAETAQPAAELDAGAAPADSAGKRGTGGGKVPWCVVGGQRFDAVPGQRDVASPPTEAATQAAAQQETPAEPPAPPVKMPMAEALPEPAAVVDSASLSDFALGETEDEAGGIDGAAAGAAEGEESDWGEDAADWE